MRRIREQHPVLVGVLATLVAVAAVVAILAAVTPRSRAATVVSEEYRLTQGRSMLDRALGPSGGAGWSPPQKLYTDASGNLHVQDRTGEAQYTPGLPTGVGLGFYRVRGHASAYCLVSRHRHLVVQQDARDVVVRAGRGACPRPSVRPVHPTS
ncbi:hypothetical protein [Nocardioides korecus]